MKADSAVTAPVVSRICPTRHFCKCTLPRLDLRGLFLHQLTGRDVGDLAIAISTLFEVGGGDGEDVQPAVVVHIDPGGAKTRVLKGGKADAAPELPWLINSETMRSSSPSLSKSPASTPMFAFSSPAGSSAPPAS